MSRRTRRADQQQPAPAHPTIVSNNPIFFREDGCREADTVHAAVQDVLDDVQAAVGKPLPLPPSRTQSHLPAGSRAGTALAMSRHGRVWVLRREPRDDPFLAAYVACTKNSGGKVDAEPAKRQLKKNKHRSDTVVQWCGIWSGWAAGSKYAGAMSCKYGSDVVAVRPVHGDGRPAATATQACPVPRLHLSRQLVVIPARKRALARERAQS